MAVNIFCLYPFSKHPSLHGKQKVLGSIPGMGKHFSPKYHCSLHQEQSLKSSWMIGKELRQNTLAWYTCPDRCINTWLHPEDHQLWLENFYAPAFPQVGHWNSVLCSCLNLDTTIPHHTIPEHHQTYLLSNASIQDRQIQCRKDQM